MPIKYFEIVVAKSQNLLNGHEHFLFVYPMCLKTEFLTVLSGFFFSQKSDTTEVLEVSPSFSSSQPARVAERIILQDDALEDSSASEICRVIKAQSLVPDRAPSAPATAWFSSRLSDMDSQLAALQNIADNLEKDFSNSRMVHKDVL